MFFRLTRVDSPPHPPQSRAEISLKRKQHLKLRRIHYCGQNNDEDAVGRGGAFRRKYDCFFSNGFGAEISLKRKKHLKLRRIHYCGHNKDEVTVSTEGPFRRKYECFFRMDSAR